jgi:WS/DGAT/MGAT family acyltransferase
MTTAPVAVPRSAEAARVPVASNDRMWLQDSATNLMIINAVFTTDRMDLATVREVFQRRVLDADPAQRERFTRRVALTHHTPYWEPDPDFDISRHIVAASPSSIRSAEELQRYVGELASTPLPADRPPWQFYVVEDFGEGGSACVVRIHHCIGDGVALVSIIFHLMEQAGGPASAPTPSANRQPPATPARRLLRAAQISLAAPGILLRRLLWAPDRHTLHGRPLSGTKRVAWTAPVDIQVIKDAKNRLGATVNDVLMACVSGALSRHIQRRDGRCVPAVRVSMPVNVRPAHAPLTLENRFAAVPLELPAGIAAARDRVLAVKRRMDALKQSVVPIVIYGLQKLLVVALPQPVSHGLIDFLANKCTAVVTNVVGPQGELTLAGRRVRSLMFWVPQRADIGLGISILSFAGKVQVGVFCDTILMPDPAELVRDFEEEFAALPSL